MDRHSRITDNAFAVSALTSHDDWAGVFAVVEWDRCGFVYGPFQTIGTINGGFARASLTECPLIRPRPPASTDARALHPASAEDHAEEIADMEKLNPKSPRRVAADAGAEVASRRRRIACARCR